MIEILPDLERWQGEGEEIALATVLRVRRSAPRPPGARLAVTRSGRMSGSVSGGCVEADVIERAMQVLDHRKPVVASYGIADELGFKVGLSCGGSIDVLIEPFVPGAEWVALARGVEGQREAGYAIGLAPEALLGRKLALVPGQEPVGSIDPALDGAVSEQAAALGRAGGARVVVLPWRNGEAEVFLEAFLPDPQLVIVGATHTAIALSRLAREVGFQVHVLDARSALATEERFPQVQQLIRAWPEEAMERVSLGGQSFVAVLTHDPKFDIPALAAALRSPARYIGALGSRVTHEGRKEKLREEGFTEADLARIRAPIGLNLGSRTPEELALAILAEMVAARYDLAPPV